MNEFCREEIIPDIHTETETEDIKSANRTSNMIFNFKQSILY
jgi:hypothetical protein